eukprot:gnl/TRDRNA2_/TRDRNA2_188622_c0_seq1.p1 gnl/TRDRNA2_/TRDRNA2_188622_c0~~gnl/TRDRNA2_/TRDRNA2_188622_c0_seq1.p1  ORF type:complete len:377 (+),score=69.44 gnl/TRDRNA2_/TRDRNA2_188622_c0_seq1:57-1187(+)
MAVVAASRPGVPVCLVTGFLGAGKTTLLNFILRNRAGLRAAVFVNEFGAVDIDGSLIRWGGAVDEANIVTLDNGCICCEVNADLAGQLKRVLRERAGMIDFVAIETSGVCDPAPVLATLEVLDGLAAATHLDSVLAVVDAASLGHGGEAATSSASMLGLQEAAESQLAHSDVVLLNKCDLLGGVGSPQAVCAQEALEKNLRRLARRSGRPMPRVIPCERALVDLSLISSLQPPVCSGSEGESLTPAAREVRSTSPARKKVRLTDAFSGGAHAALRTRARSFVYTAARPFDPLKFEAWVEEGGPPRSICRAKGLLWMRGVPRHVVFQLAGSRTNPFETLDTGEPPSSSRIVFIGEASAMKNADESAIAEALDACLVN